MAEPPHLIAAGRHVNLVTRGGWEYATRPDIGGIVAIVALTDDGRIVLIEQHRPPAGCPVIELPAGLAGDRGDASADEALLEAAQRELREESGYEASQWARLFEAYTSPGISDEILTFFRATSLRRVSAGGADANERITVHMVPLAGLGRFVESRRVAGCAVDLKLYAGLYAALHL